MITMEIVAAEAGDPSVIANQRCVRYVKRIVFYFQLFVTIDAIIWTNGHTHALVFSMAGGTGVSANFLARLYETGL